MDQRKVTKTRRTFDRALQALPLTQHNRIWPLYIQFIRSHNLPETAIRVYRRHLKVTVPPSPTSINGRLALESGQAEWVLVPQGS